MKNTKNYKQIMREFVDNNYEPIKTTKNIESIIKPTKRTILVPQNKWLEKDNGIEKVFYFFDTKRRNRFLNFIFKYEEENKHHADILIKENYIKIRLKTKDINQVTELDKEFAKFADDSFIDVITKIKN